MSTFTNFAKLPLELRLQVWEYAIEEASCRRYMTLFARYSKPQFCANIKASPFLRISTDSRKAALSYYSVRVKVMAISQRLTRIQHQLGHPQNVDLYSFISCSDQGESFCRDDTLPCNDLQGEHKGYIYANPVKDVFSMDIPDTGYLGYRYWIMPEHSKIHNPFCWIAHVISHIKQSRMGQDTHMVDITIWKGHRGKIFTLHALARSGLDFGRSPRRICVSNEHTPDAQMVYRPDIAWPIERVLDDLDQFNNTKDWDLLPA
ncbi:hypothetical protein PG984_000476 [Apiospora sp. TS-2023a]